MKITQTQRAILDCIIENPKIGRSEIAAKLMNITKDGVKYNLRVLQQKGFIKRIGPDFGGYWKVMH